jgi:hypothetical protein
MLNNLKFILSFIFLLFNLATPVHAIDITLKWARNNEPHLAGYRAYYREEGQLYNFANPYWESSDPICTIYDLDETKTYYFVVRAFDTNGLESANSNEVLLIEGIPANNQPIVNNGGGGSGGGCFVATAAYGSLMEPHVKILREFRDRFLLDNTLGKRFVSLYYSYSPPIADVIAKHDSLRAMVRISLLPVVSVSWIALKIGPLPTVALMLIFIYCFVSPVCFRRRYKE